MSNRGFTHPATQNKKIKASVFALGARLQARRLELDLTQEELAEKAEVSTSLIRQIETGHRVPSLPMLVYLAGLLELEVSLKK